MILGRANREGILSAMACTKWSAAGLCDDGISRITLSSFRNLLHASLREAQRASVMSTIHAMRGQALKDAPHRPIVNGAWTQDTCKATAGFDG